MSEEINGKKVFTLLDVNRSIQKTLAKRYGTAFWVKAEMIRLNHYPHSGHCYPDLVEKREGKVVAQMRANLWRTDYNRVNKQFQTTLKEPLKDGIKILFLARISFDPQYGLSLQILDIDPAFTLGDMEQEKQKTITQLKQDKLFDKNRSLHLPLLPHRIAIISVETSKGYADFRKIITDNEFGYTYFHFLFPALLQGDKAVPSILLTLERIKKVLHHFDMVAIIRGGGGDIGLACYNDYELCKAIAGFPLPVITGIGHATNETVAELIAWQNCITPTKMAEWLMQRTHQFAVPLTKAKERIVSQSKLILKSKKERFAIQKKYFISATTNRISFNFNALSHLQSGIVQQTFFVLKQNRNILIRKQNELAKNVTAFQQKEQSTLSNLEQQVKLMDPIRVLKRGYSITYINGKIINRTGLVEEGKEITTAVSDGIIKSRITNIENNTTNE